MKISLIQPSRNNLKYLKWSYDSIRKNQDNHEVEICVADDASTDGTWEWCQKMMDKDPYFKAILNDTGERLGHTILYDRLINEVATNDICMIYHADMYLCPEALDAIEEELKEKTIVSLTRIEPPLHPDGPEKILKQGDMIHYTPPNLKKIVIYLIVFNLMGLNLPKHGMGVCIT